MSCKTFNVQTQYLCWSVPWTKVPQVMTQTALALAGVVTVGGLNHKQILPKWLHRCDFFCSLCLLLKDYSFCLLLFQPWILCDREWKKIVAHVAPVSPRDLSRVIEQRHHVCKLVPLLGQFNWQQQLGLTYKWNKNAALKFFIEKRAPIRNV